MYFFEAHTHFTRLLHVLPGIRDTYQVMFCMKVHTPWDVPSASNRHQQGDPEVNRQLASQNIPYLVAKMVGL